MSSSILSIRLIRKQRQSWRPWRKPHGDRRSFLAAEAIEKYIVAESWQLAEIEAGV